MVNFFRDKATRGLILLIASAILAGAFLLFFGPVFYSMFVSDKIFNGIYIRDSHAGNKTQSQIKSILDRKYPSNSPEKIIVLSAKEKIVSFNYKDILVKYDVSKAVEEAYSIGRNGSFVSRFVKLTKTKVFNQNIDLTYSYDEKKVSELVEKLHQSIFIKEKEHQLVINPNESVKIVTGHKGQYFDKDKVIKKVHQLIESGESKMLEIPVMNTYPKDMSLNEFYDKINTAPKNSYVDVKNNQPVTVPHVVGITISKTELKRYIDWNKNIENKEIILPVAFVEPKIKSSDVPKFLFRDVLSTASTVFNTNTKNNANRGVNIKLASSKLNGRIIPPNGTLSFNNIVGPRSNSLGYQPAHSYIAGKIVDTYGGGVCQVSTTLYNSGIQSGLGIVERNNHSFTVGYVPYGADASVSYGGPDLKMKNNSYWPIKILSWVTDDNQLFFQVVGTNETPGRTIELKHVTVKTTKYKTEYINDPNILEGKKVVTQSGADGYVIDTFQIVKQDGVVVKETKLYRSTYSALTKKVKVGTKKVEVVERPIETPVAIPLAGEEIEFEPAE